MATSGFNTTAMVRHIINLEAYLGKTIQLAICDVDTSGWSAAYFDSLVSNYSSRPGFRVEYATQTNNSGTCYPVFRDIYITKDIKNALESINGKYMDDAYAAYNLGDVSKASVLFEKAAKAAGTAPLSQLDTNAIYNAGFTAWQAGEYARAKGFFEEGIANGYYGEGGESYAKLADIADKLGDKEASKRYLTEGSQKFPESQSLLIGLINYYINSGEDTAQLFNLFAEAQKNEPTNASLFYVEGNARKKLGQYEEALTAYNKAIEVNPKYEWGYIGKGVLLYDQAVEIAEKANSEYDDAKYNALLGEFEKCYKGCVEPFEQAFELVQDNEIKASLAEYLKNVCFRFRTDPEFQAKYEKYESFGK